jgi:hypothetical protein
MQIKPVVKYFLWAEILDITTTNIGVIYGLRETNFLLTPWSLGIIIKILGIVIVAIIMQYIIPNRKFNIVIPILASIAIPYNIINIIQNF